MVVPVTVRVALVDTNTFPTDAVIVHTPFDGTKMFAVVGEFTGDDCVQVWYGVYGPGLVLTPSGVDWTNVAY